MTRHGHDEREAQESEEREVEQTAVGHFDDAQTEEEDAVRAAAVGERDGGEPNLRRRRGDERPNSLRGDPLRLALAVAVPAVLAMFSLRLRLLVLQGLERLDHLGQVQHDAVDDEDARHGESWRG